MTPSHAIALLAEDEPALRLWMADILVDAGFDVLEAENAVGALEHLERNPTVTLLMTDVQMPGPMNGFALAREVATRWPAIPIIVCSGQATPQADELPRGARFVRKPVSAAMIADLVRAMASKA